MLLLRATESTPDQMRIRVVLPNGESVNYPVPMVKVQKYTLEEIYQKDCCFCFHSMEDEYCRCIGGSQL